VPDLTSKIPQYKTIQGDMWDIVSLRTHGDEHSMSTIQDANFDHRFTDMFPASTLLDIPSPVYVHYDLKAGTSVPNLNAILPWR
jgi:hypothetical protein